MSCPTVYSLLSSCTSMPAHGNSLKPYWICGSPTPKARFAGWSLVSTMMLMMRINHGFDQKCVVHAAHIPRRSQINSNIAQTESTAPHRPAQHSTVHPYMCPAAWELVTDRYDSQGNVRAATICVGGSSYRAKPTTNVQCNMVQHKTVRVQTYLQGDVSAQLVFIGLCAVGVCGLCPRPRCHQPWLEGVRRSDRFCHCCVTEVSRACRFPRLPWCV